MHIVRQSSNHLETQRYNLFLTPRAQTYLYGVTDIVSIESSERALDAFGEYMLCLVHGMEPEAALRSLILEGLIDDKEDLKRTHNLFDIAFQEMRGALDHLKHHSQQRGLMPASITLKPIPREYGECGYSYTVYAFDPAEFRDNPYGSRGC